MSESTSRAQAPRPEQGAGSLRVGRMSKPHGLKGGLKLEMFTDNPKLRFFPGATFALQVPKESEWFDRSVTIRELRWFNGVPVGFFEEVPDRNAAESIVKAILWIDEAAVDDGEEENAWYDHQLVGLEVRREGVKIGTVAEVQHMPAQDLLSINTPSGIVLVPFVEAIVPSVDLKAGIVTVTPPAGLFEELPEDSAESSVERPAESPAEDAAEDPTDVAAVSHAEGVAPEEGAS